MKPIKAFIRGCREGFESNYYHTICTIYGGPLEQWPWDRGYSIGQFVQQLRWPGGKPE